MVTRQPSLALRASLCVLEGPCLVSPGSTMHTLSTDSHREVCRLLDSNCCKHISPLRIFDRPQTRPIVSVTTLRHDDDRSTLSRVSHQSVPDMRFLVLVTLPGKTVLQITAASFRRRSHTDYRDQTAATSVTLRPITSLLSERLIPHTPPRTTFVMQN